jgi:hypothetical protein
MVMVCLEKSRLQTEWASATNGYAQLVAPLTNHMRILPKDDYDKGREAIEAAGAVSEKMRHALDLHVLTHGC